MAWINDIWSDLSTPSDYAGQPVKAVTNQFGHWGIGIFLTATTCFLWAAVFGELPYRIALGQIVTLGYLILWEIGVQRLYRGLNRNVGDALADTCFVSLGSAFVLVGLKEASSDPHIVLVLHEQNGLLATLIFVACLAVHAACMAMLPQRDT